jgi:hypothetical protein
MTHSLTNGLHAFWNILIAGFSGALTPGQFGLITLWVGAICTIGIYTLLYRENPVYRVFEYLFLGVGAAYGFLRLYQDNLMIMWWAPLKAGEWWWMVPFLLGLLYFTIYFDKFAWMARMLIGTLMGVAAGYAFQQVVITYLPQVTNSFQPLTPGAVTAWSKAQGIVLTEPAWHVALNNVVFFVTLIAVMTYFFFSFEHKNKGVAGTAKLGRWLLMVSFGTMFGSTITARVALAVSRIMYLVIDWAHLIKI